MLLRRRSKTVKRRTIIFGLKSDNSSREILIRLLSTVVNSGDNVLAIHVQEPNDTFNPNTFHIHEDLCKLKQVDLQFKVCEADSYISMLSHQVRENHAAVLALGSSCTSRSGYSVYRTFLKGLPPTCTLLVIDYLGRILLEESGTSQQGSESRLLQSSHSITSPGYTYTEDYQQINTHCLQKSLTLPSSLPSSSQQTNENRAISFVEKTKSSSDFASPKPLQRLALPDPKGKGRNRKFTSQQLNHATNNFDPRMLIGEGGYSKVYRANLEDGRVAAVKLLTSHLSRDDFMHEVEILSDIIHDNIIQIVGFCNDGVMQAIVYNLLTGSLKQYLRKLGWRERMEIAIGVAKALKYLHHSCNPPIIHRDVKSSNILLTDNFQPQLSDFGEATLLQQSQHEQIITKPYYVVGTFGYLAPEYMMYGKVDEKIDVYSYGVVLLELITGKEAIEENENNQESLILRARSLLSCGLGNNLIDPNLKDNYNKEEMEVMIMAARLCLLYSSSRRPTMKTILKLFEEPGYMFKMKKTREELLNDARTNKDETDLWRCNESYDEEFFLIEDICPSPD